MDAYRAVQTGAPPLIYICNINILRESAILACNSHHCPCPASWGARAPDLLREQEMRSLFRTALVALLVFGCAASPAAATSRIKDLASIEGVRQNQLIGYGLVVGLNGTGDTLNNTPFTKQSLQAMLERLGVNIRGQT